MDVELANYVDAEHALSGTIPEEEVRKTTIRGVVDTGATRLVVPDRIAKALGVRTIGDVSVRYADGRSAQRRLVGGIQLTFLGRTSVFNAVVEPDRESALIGAIVLEDLDLLADGTNQRLVPRDPKQIISEIE